MDTTAGTRVGGALVNSLCGISLNATAERMGREFVNLKNSQFPLWDFFECNVDWEGRMENIGD
jgi:hypothetical protein